MNSWAKKTVVLLFMQSLDSTLRFKRTVFGLMSSRLSTGKKPTPFIKESVQLINEYAKAVNGVSTSFALETIAGIPSTAHILGGAVMGKNPSEGVIDKKIMALVSRLTPHYAVIILFKACKNLLNSLCTFFLHRHQWQSQSVFNQTLFVQEIFDA